MKDLLLIETNTALRFGRGIWMLDISLASEICFVNIHKHFDAQFYYARVYRWKIDELCSIYDVPGVYWDVYTV